MSQKWLQRIGLASMVCACVFVGVGVFTIQDRITLTVAEEADSTAVDPIGLLADDVATLRRDFQEFGAALGSGLESLSTHWDEVGFEHRSALEWRLAVLEAQIEALGETGALAQRGAGTDLPRTDLLREGEVPRPPSDPLPAPAASLPGEPPKVAATTPAKSPGFLSFKLPSGKFRFDDPQRFQILGSLSRVGFDAKSTLHDFTGVTSRVSGEFSMALGDPGSGAHGMIAVEAATLKTGVEGRDKEMLHHLATETAPQITFELTSLVPATVEPVAMTVSGEAIGQLTIAGNSKEVRMPVTLSVDESRRVAISGELPLKMSEFGVTPPSQLGMIKVEDTVRVWLELRARAIGPAQLSAKGSP